MHVTDGEVAGASVVDAVATTSNDRKRSPAKPRSGSTTRSRPSGTSRSPKKAPDPPRRRPSVVLRALRAAFGPHANELFGVAAIVLGLIVALSVFADLAGPFGRAVDDAASVVVGRLRFLLPFGLLWGGLALIRADDREPDPTSATAASDRDEPRLRLGVGAVVAGVALSGLFHLAAGRPGIEEGPDELGRAGGALGYTIGGSLAAVASVPGAVIVLVALMLVALVAFTGRSPRQLMARLGGPTSAGARPVAGVVGRSFRSLFRLGASTDDSVVDLTGAAPVRSGPYDQDTDPDGPTDASPAPAKARKPRRPSAATVVEPAGSSEQLGLGLGPAAEGSSWKLPSLDLLSRIDARAVDKKAVEERGRRLERALAAHGVETRLVGMVVGPTVTRYELELGAGVKVDAGHQPQQGHRLQPGRRRRPDPRPDPGAAGDRCRGPERGA